MPVLDDVPHDGRALVGQPAGDGQHVRMRRAAEVRIGRSKGLGQRGRQHIGRTCEVDNSAWVLAAVSCLVQSTCMAAVRLARAATSDMRPMPCMHATAGSSLPDEALPHAA